MMSGLKGDISQTIFPYSFDHFKKHVACGFQEVLERITSVAEKRRSLFLCYIRPGKPLSVFLEEKLKSESRMQNESTSLSPCETYNPR